MASVQHPTPISVGIATTGGITFASNVTAGNLIAIHIGWNTRTTQPATVTDSLGNTYTQRALRQHPSTAISSAWYTAENIAGGACTITVTWAVNTSWTMHCYENSGRATSGATDTTGTNEGSAATTSSAALTTGANAGDDLLSGIRTNNAVTTPTYGSGYTGDGTTATIRNFTENEDNVAASTAFQGDFGWTNSVDWVSTQIALQVPVAASGQPFHLRDERLIPGLAAIANRFTR